MAKNKTIPTLQMFTDIYRDSAGKSECGDVKFMGIACIPAIPVILKSPQSDFHVKIVGILTLQVYPTLNVGKSCNKITFVDISVKFVGISCKF